MLEWRARINLANQGALQTIAHSVGAEIYEIAERHEGVQNVEVSLYYTDLIDKYGNDIPTEEAFDSTFRIDDLDEVRKCRDGLSYAIDNEVNLSHHVISGDYSCLWQK